MNKRTKKMVMGIIVAVVIVAVIGVFVGKRVNSAKIENEKNKQYGGEYTNKESKVLPDKTVELQSDLENDIKAKFVSAQIAKVENSENSSEIAYTVTVTGEVESKDFIKAIREIYVKYRDKGYKGVLYLYIDNHIVGAFPPRPLR